MTTRWMCALALGTALCAQTSPGPPSAPPNTDGVKAYLKLTDAQLQALEQVRQTSMTARKSVLEELRIKQAALKDALDKGSRDAAVLGRALLEIDALHRKLEESAKTEHDQALAILTATQKTQLKTLEEAAKLIPVAHQAGLLGLLEEPEQAGPAGPGFGPGRGLGLGPGAGLGMRGAAGPRGPMGGGGGLHRPMGAGWR